MGLSIGSSGTQISLLNKQAQANRFQSETTARLATGLRLYNASEDPAGLIGAEQLRGDIVEISARSNTLDAQQRQINVQQSGRQLASGVLQEVRGLLVEAADGSNSTDERAAIQLQVDSSLDALETLGAATGFALPESLEALRAGGSANAVNGDPAEGAALVAAELSSINLASAAAGAYQKYTLDVDRQLAESQAVATASAPSSLADADYITESSNLVKGGILSEVSLNTLALSQQIRGDQIRSLFAVL